ncbi:MAG: YaaR family protein [Spirochaetia bacterium]|jgi:uncharacterized protein YaaR (DUF327 family)|nr:YaaR family protein [Spirochaetia bacterium]
MGKISAADKSFRKKNSSTQKKKVNKGAVEKLSFSSILNIDKNESVGFDDIDYSNLDLEDLLDSIHEAGDALKDIPTLHNVKNYKGAVSKFLKYIVKNSLETKTDAGANLNPLKKQKKYTIIRVIDENLERLAAGVLQNQSDKLYILEKIEEINGLIVNLLK